jgi:hypothetical protein
MDNLATHKAAALYDACTSAKANMDMNKDSLAVAKDAYGYSIGYSLCLKIHFHNRRYHRPKLI